MNIDFKQSSSLVKKAASAWLDDYAPSMGAALSYYTLFSLAPLLLIVIAVAGIFFGAEAARGEIVRQLGGLLGDQGAQTIQSLLQDAAKPRQSALATIIGTVLLLVGATSVFAELQDALDRIWRAPARVKTSGLWNALRSRLLSFGMILGIVFLLLVSLVVGAVLAALGKWWDPLFGGWTVLASIFNLAIDFGLTTALFAMIYKLMPRVHIQWHDVWVGALVTAALFTVGKYLIGLYIGKSGVASSFGAAGSLVVLLLWVYYSAQIFLMGAEFTWVYAHTFGSLKGTALPQAAALTPTRGSEVAANGHVAEPLTSVKTALAAETAPRPAPPQPPELPEPSWRSIGLGLLAGGVAGWAARKALRLWRAHRAATTQGLPYRRMHAAPR
ncbi:MAG TPA: YihY/virulence factor BrkB family protein [Albitalea sp.]|nr:YihY/virulence factor BrkB family protein [Albitalea sp.]